MDVILEIFDTFLFDRIYAQILPASRWLSYKTLNGAVNSTMAAIQENPAAYSNYKFQPASAYFSVQPSSWAYRSELPRDDPFRQLLSLFLITSYVFQFISHAIGAMTDYTLGQALRCCRLFLVRHHIIYIRL
jgi:lathosterol oxidase